MVPGKHHINRVYGKIVAAVGEFDIDLTKKHIITGPNGYGKTIILKLTASMYQLMRGEFPHALINLVSITRNDYFDGPETTWYQMFDKFGMVLDDGTEATLEPAFDASSENKSTYIYTCGEEKLEFDLSTMNRDTKLPECRTSGICMFLDSWRHSYMDELIAKILAKCSVSADELNEIVKWHNKLFAFRDGQATIFENVPVSLPDEPFGKFKKRVKSWMERLSHGEQEFLLCSMVLQHSDVMILDDAGQGLHLVVQMKFDDLCKALGHKKFGNCQVFMSTHMPEIINGIWSADYDLFAESHPDETKNNDEE